MGLISKAWTNLAPPGAISRTIDLTRPAVSVELFYDVAADLSLRSALASHLRFGTN
jgi:hypothetical protein